MMSAPSLLGDSPAGLTRLRAGVRCEASPRARIVRDLARAEVRISRKQPLPRRGPRTSDVAPGGATTGTLRMRLLDRLDSLKKAMIYGRFPAPWGFGGGLRGSKM